MPPRSRGQRNRLIDAYDERRQRGKQKDYEVLEDLGDTEWPGQILGNAEGQYYAPSEGRYAGEPIPLPDEPGYDIGEILKHYSASETPVPEQYQEGQEGEDPFDAALKRIEEERYANDIPDPPYWEVPPSGPPESKEWGIASALDDAMENRPGLFDDLGQLDARRRPSYGGDPDWNQMGPPTPDSYAGPGVDDGGGLPQEASDWEEEFRRRKMVPSWDDFQG